MSRSLALLLAFFLAGGAAAEDATLCQAGWKAWQEKDSARALELYRECVQKGDLSPSSLANAERNIGVLLFDESPALAVEAFGRALAASPPDPWQDYANRGNAWLRVGDSRKALADFDEALALEPDNAQATYGRGLAYERLGREFDAYAQFARAARLGTASAGVTEKLGEYDAFGLNRIATLHGDGFGALGSSYAVGPSARAPKLGAISASPASCALEDSGAVALADHPGAESLRASGRFEFPSGGVSVVVPQLAGLETVDVRVHLADHARGVRDDYLTLSSGAAGPARAAVLVTTLAKRMQSSREVHRAILDQVEELGAGFPRGDLVLRDLDGPWGPIVEGLARNRAAGGVCFPTSPFQRAAPGAGPSIGVSRWIHRGELLIELALIVSIPADVPKGEQAEYARKRMDELMGAVTIPSGRSRVSLPRVPRYARAYLRRLPLVIP